MTIMRFLTTLVLHAALALSLGAALPAAAAPAPLSAYGGLPSIESVEISPDGTRLAVVATSEGQRLIAVKTLPDGMMQTYGVGAVKVRRLDWLGDNRLIISTSQTATAAGVTGPRQEYIMGFDLNLATRKIQPLLNKPLSRGGTGSNIRDADTGKIGALMNVMVGPQEVRTAGAVSTLYLRGVTFPDRYGVLTVFKIDPKTGETDIVEMGVRDTRDFVLGQDGLAVARADYGDDAGRWTLRLRQGAGWKTVRTVDAKTDAPYLAGLGRDGKSVVVGELVDGRTSLREVSGDGDWGEPLDVPGADGMIHDPTTHRLIGLYALVGEEDRYTFFHPADQKAWNSVRSAFRGERVQLESWSQDRTKIVARVDSPTEGPAYILVDLKTKHANWLGGRYQQLTKQDIAPVRPIRFKAKDGLELNGYLTTPFGAEAKNLPLVVFPHGGPASRDEPGFDWWAQAMASRGYAVLQVNFRGSNGYGWEHLSAGFGEWGRKMQTDLSDGVRHLAAEGIIDPARVCIVGASYGGYAALAGAAIDTGVYRCAASYGGVSDLKRMVAWSKTRSEASFRYWIRFMGAESGKDEALVQLSPAALGDKVSIPVLLIHGRDDSVVPLEQSRVMSEALTKAGKPVEYVVLKGEDHWLSRGDTRIQTLTSIVAFLEKHNPPN